MSESNKRKSTIWLIVFILLLLVSLSVATYAYYSAKTVTDGSFEVDIKSKEIDILQVNGKEDIYVEVNNSNFNQYTGANVSGNTTVDVDLYTAKETSTYCYEVTVELPDEPVFIYTNGIEPELLLNVSYSTDKKNYTNVISNMDITTRTDDVKVPAINSANKYVHKITATKGNQTIAYWKAELTFVWFPNVNQIANDQKTYKASLKANIVEC